jgi:hypothetical protein
VLVLRQLWLEVAVLVVVAVCRQLQPQPVLLLLLLESRKQLQWLPVTCSPGR